MKNGIHVMKFTNSEISEDPIKCAKEVYEFFLSKRLEAFDYARVYL